MYRVDYYTLAMIKNEYIDHYRIGNIVQYRDIFYTETEIENIPTLLQRRVNDIKGDNKYKVIITKIEEIEGHM